MNLSLVTISSGFSPVSCSRQVVITSQSLSSDPATLHRLSTRYAACSWSYAQKQREKKSPLDFLPRFIIFTQDYKTKRRHHLTLHVEGDEELNELCSSTALSVAVGSRNHSGQSETQRHNSPEQDGDNSILLSGPSAAREKECRRSSTCHREKLRLPTPGLWVWHKSADR